MTEHIDSRFTGHDGTEHTIKRMKSPTGQILVDDWQGHGPRVLMDLGTDNSEAQVTACIEDYREQAAIAKRPLSRVAESYVPPRKNYASRVLAEEREARSQRVVAAFLKGIDWGEIADTEGVCIPTAKLIVTRARKLDPSIPKRTGGRRANADERSRQILAAWTRGDTVEEIAETFNLKPAGVRNHILHARRKDPSIPRRTRGRKPRELVAA